MKKKNFLTTILFLGLLCIYLTACGSQTYESETLDTTTKTEESSDTTDSNDVDETSEIVYTFTDMEITKYSLGPFKFRDTPSQSGEILGHLSKGEEVTVTGQCNENNWYRFEYDGNIVYINDDFLSDENPLDHVSETIDTTVSMDASGTSTPATETPVTDAPVTETVVTAASADYWTWTASTGYVLKLKNEYIDYPFWSRDETWIIKDESTNYRPDSEYMRAYVEFLDGTSIASLSPEQFFMSPAGLPLVEMPTEKLTSPSSTPSWEAFASAFNSLWFLHTGEPDRNPVFAGRIFITDENVLKLYASIDAAMTNKYCFNLRYQDDCWKLTIYVNADALPTQIMWYGIQNALRLVTPDAEILYQQFYEAFYDGNHVFPSADTWVTIGNSQAMATQNRDSISFYFK